MKSRERWWKKTASNFSTGTRREKLYRFGELYCTSNILYCTVL